MSEQIKLVHTTDLGSSLEVANNNAVEVKISPLKGNVTLERTLTGLRADVELPEFKKSVTDASIEDGKLKLTFSDKTETELALPATAIDVKLDKAELTEDNKLKLTLSNGDIIETDLAKFVDAPKSAQEYFDEIIALTNFKSSLITALTQDTDFVEAVKDKMIEALKGVEIQDTNGNSKGYLITLS